MVIMVFGTSLACCGEQERQKIWQSWELEDAIYNVVLGWQSLSFGSQTAPTLPVTVDPPWLSGAQKHQQRAALQTGGPSASECTLQGHGTVEPYPEQRGLQQAMHHGTLSSSVVMKNPEPSPLERRKERATHVGRGLIGF
jgi:hypothetical protein